MYINIYIYACMHAYIYTHARAHPPIPPHTYPETRATFYRGRGSTHPLLLPSNRVPAESVVVKRSKVDISCIYTYIYICVYTYVCTYVCMYV